MQDNLSVLWYCCQWGPAKKRGNVTLVIEELGDIT